jgi:hypothetical protein
MFKRLDPRDINITPFKAHKEFTVTNVDSGSGVYGFRIVSGSTHSFDTTRNKTEFESASFYEIPSWFLIRGLYYRDTENNFNNFGQNNGKQYRFLQPSASVIAIPQKLYGERIKPKSITIDDDSGSSTLKIVDDGNGNLYDNDFSASFSKFATSEFTSSADGTGSFVGNVFYEHGVMVFSNTGSKYVDIGTGLGSDGYSVRYKAQTTIKEYSYTCVVGENEFNATQNISATTDRSGSVNVSGSHSWRLFPPGDAATQSGSYKHYYQQASTYNNFVTHSEFRPYITKVGLYNDFNELIAIGQLARPVKNDKDLSLAIQVRFDA